jgi:Fe-S-cluster-containing hydrogenase component 2
MPGVKYSGRLSDAELAGVMPPSERLVRGPVAVIECVQEIPCNPCEKACPFGAITVGEDITACPVIDRDKCRGCGLCISRCPGLAIFVVDASGDEATIMLPYEYCRCRRPAMSSTPLIAAASRPAKGGSSRSTPPPA